MLYQLPNGRTVYMSLEEYLDLTDEDIQFYVSTGQGAEPTNPFFGSCIKKPLRDVEEEPQDNSLDYNPDRDEPGTIGPTSIHDIPDDSDPSNF